MSAGGTRMAKAEPGEQQADANLAGLDGSRAAAPSPARSTRTPGASVTTKIGCTNWNQLAGKTKPRMSRFGAALGEQVQRRAGLLERRPEQCRRDEQHQDRGRPFALLRRSSPAEKISQENTTAEMPSRHQPMRVGDAVAVMADHAGGAQQRPASANTPTPIAQATQRASLLAAGRVPGRP